jgi:UDP-GlcNAc:undecaprenyl-phosphate GlcNAc-1-phosphate transferase
MRYSDAVFAFLVATAAAALLTPLTARLARRIGAMDFPSARGLSLHPTPRLGGLAILAGVLIAAAFWLPGTISLPHVPHTPKGSGGTVHTWGIIVGAVVITVVGAVDDWKGLPPALKLIGQIAAAAIAVEGGVKVNDVTVPLFGALQFPNEGGVISGILLVGMMNVVNFSDGVDGLAAGLCTIDGIAFAVIVFDLPGGTTGAAELAAMTAGGSLGFLFHNLPPARVFMGDSGANLLGYLLGVVAVIGSLKTGAVLTLAVPLIILAVPFLDTGFVIAKRLKYRRKPWSADANHFHHRMARIGFSQRKTIAYLYGWTFLLASLAVALGVYHTSHRALVVVILVVLAVLALATSVYLVYVLEIVKFRGLRARQLREVDPDTSEHEIDEQVQRDIETGEFDQLG